MSDTKAVINYEKCKKNDSIKTKYCSEHKIKLLRIPYFEFSKIDTILKDNIKFVL